MSTIEYKSTLTPSRIERYNNKADIARQLFDAYHILSAVIASSCEPELKRRAEKLQTRIAWGE